MTIMVALMTVLQDDRQFLGRGLRLYNDLEKRRVFFYVYAVMILGPIPCLSCEAEETVIQLAT